jgi:hypothetical protein
MPVTNFADRFWVKNMKIIIFTIPPVVMGLVCAFIASAVAQENSRVNDSYGVLAAVRGQGRDFHGFGTGGTPEAASDAAMARCENKRCTVVQTYGPGQCAHIALGYRQIHWNNRLFSEREKEFVLENCNKVDRDCNIIISQCFPE